MGGRMDGWMDGQGNVEKGREREREGVTDTGQI